MKSVSGRSESAGTVSTRMGWKRVCVYVCTCALGAGAVLATLGDVLATERPH